MCRYVVGARGVWEGDECKNVLVITSNVCAGMLLGQGAFGKVMKAEADGIDGTDKRVPVAVKMVKGRQNCDAFNLVQHNHNYIAPPINQLSELGIPQVISSPSIKQSNCMSSTRFR